MSEKKRTISFVLFRRRETN